MRSHEQQLVFNPKLEDESNGKCKVISSWSSTTNGLVASVVSGVITQEQYLRVLNFSLPEKSARVSAVNV